MRTNPYIEKHKWGRYDRRGGFMEPNDLPTWWGLFRILRWLNRVRSGRWTWAMNTQCKYINVRIDTRTGHCVIYDRDGSKITPDQLEWQYSSDTPNPPAWKGTVMSEPVNRLTYRDLVSAIAASPLDLDHDLLTEFTKLTISARRNTSGGVDVLYFNIEPVESTDE